ncbi:MAG: hypothetical protein HGB08_00345 [Candidatus Moranbacteria bacterium]|nr:hypothetical protein [Candidatus Moranbacteria bacterium]
MGSFAVFGYIKNKDKHLEILEEEAVIVRLIFNMFLNEKKSAYEIAAHLTSAGNPSPEASAILHKKKSGETKKKNPHNFWRPERIRLILQDEIYIGKYYYDKKKKGKQLSKEEWKLGEFQFPIIIDPLTFEKTQRLLKSSKHEKKKTKSGHIYLLSGLLTCDACHNPEEKTGMMHWVGDRKELKKGSNKFTYSYKCGKKNPSKYSTTCHTIPLPAKEIEEYIVGFSKRLLANPLATYNHQRKLQSSRVALKQLSMQREGMAKLINALPNRKERLREQHSLSVIDGTELGRRYKELNDVEIKYKKDIEEIDRRISENSLSQGYEKTLELFSQKYIHTLDNIAENRADTYTLLHSLIDEIVVYSRPVENADIIAGKRKKDQMIPFRLHIKLKLPQDILQSVLGVSGQEIVLGAGRGNRTPLLSLEG